jgi:hypothetical protein
LLCWAGRASPHVISNAAARGGVDNVLFNRQESQKKNETAKAAKHAKKNKSGDTKDCLQYGVAIAGRPITNHHSPITDFRTAKTPRKTRMEIRRRAVASLTLKVQIQRLNRQGRHDRQEKQK